MYLTVNVEVLLSLIILLVSVLLLVSHKVLQNKIKLPMETTPKLPSRMEGVNLTPCLY